MPDVSDFSIARIHEGYRSGELTVTAVIEAHLARIEAYDRRGPFLNAMVNLNPSSLEIAASHDEWLAAHPGRVNGPLFGIPVVVKDNIDVEGMPMTAGFQGWKKYMPPADAPAVARIKASGGIILGKATLSEFAKGGHDNINSVVAGYTRNPYHTAYTTGGSSGGTASAVAAGFATVGLGTDTGGSVRMPAAHCAVVGLRPTVGLVSRTGVVPLDPNRDTVGPMARSVTDAAAVLDVIADVDETDSDPAARTVCRAASYRLDEGEPTLQGLRIGVLRHVMIPDCTDPRVARHFDGTVAELMALGAELVDPFVVEGLQGVPRPPQTAARFAAALTQFLRSHPGIPYPSVTEIAESGLLHPLHQHGFDLAAAAPPEDQDAATRLGAAGEGRYREAYTAAMDAAGVEVIALPTWAMLPAVNGDRNTQVCQVPTPDLPPFPEAAPTAHQSSLTFVASSLQWPALSVPSGYLGEAGLPAGLQLITRPGGERRLLSCAHAYERATRHRRRPPTTPPLPSAAARGARRP